MQADETLLELVEHAEGALHSLAYHISLTYVDTCVKLASQMYDLKNQFLDLIR